MATDLQNAFQSLADAAEAYKKILVECKDKVQSCWADGDEKQLLTALNNCINTMNTLAESYNNVKRECYAQSI